MSPLPSSPPGPARVLLLLALFALAALVWRGIGSGDARAESPRSRVTLAPCRLPEVSSEVRCGTFSVLEDRHQPEGKTIALNIAVVPAVTGAPKSDPVFILAGGPGQAATKLVGAILPGFTKIHRNRDLVFVDQRGTGKSNPLECDENQDAGLAAQFDDTLDTAQIQGCLDRYRLAGDDPRLFLTTEAMDDLDQVRAALGYDRIDLWGGSYGTRAALAYVRQHGDHVRSAIIDGVAPVTDSLLLTAAEDAERAFNLIFDACAHDAACNATYPNLRKEFVDLLSRLGKEPARVTVAHPRTGEPVALTLTRSTFVRGLHGVLYLPEISSLLPLIIHHAATGDFAPFVAQAETMSDGMSGSLAHGMFFSVLCSEDAPAATESQLAAHAGPGLLMGDSFARGILEVCSHWPAGEVAAEYHQPVRSEVPVLLLSGELDPVTPPARAEEAKATLSRGVHVVVPGVGHGATMRGCVSDLVASFIAAGNGEGLDAGCVQSLTRPPFFVGFAGPKP